jgi:hypothetical protein
MKAFLLPLSFCFLLWSCTPAPVPAKVSYHSAQKSVTRPAGDRTPASEVQNEMEAPRIKIPIRVNEKQVLPSDDIARSEDKSKEPSNLPRVATRGLLYTEQPTPQGFGAYAYIVFNADPRSAEKDRCLALCETFNAYLSPSMASDSVAEKRAQMVTFWPMTGTPGTQEPDCQQLISNYDRRLAARIAASVNKQDAAGPLLVAWSKPYGEANTEALVLDMSHFATKDLPRALRKWKGQIATNPTLWQHGWKTIVIREEIRNTIENIGPGVVTVVATFFKKSKPE